jgi:Heterokaryon incompatibility protein (HET)
MRLLTWKRLVDSRLKSNDDLKRKSNEDSKRKSNDDLELESDDNYCLIEFTGSDIPLYAVLSHTWGTDDEEVTFKELENGIGKDKAGYRKVRFCGQQAARDGLQYFWVDTCCIDKIK